MMPEFKEVRARLLRWKEEVLLEPCCLSMQCDLDARSALQVEQVVSELEESGEVDRLTW